MLKITRPSYVVAETSKEQTEILNVLTELGYSWTRKFKANQYIPLENDERHDVIYIYPNKFLLTLSSQTYLDKVKHEYTELKIKDFKPKVIL